MRLKNFFLFLISFLTGLGLFVWIYNVVGWQEIRKTLSVFTNSQGLIIFGLTLLMILIGNWKWKEILKDRGIKACFRELFSFYLASFAISFFTPIVFLGGEIFRAYALKEKHVLSWSKSMASVVIDRVLEWTTSLVVIFLGILFFFSRINLPPKDLAIIFGGVFLFFVGGISFFYFKIFRRESIIKALTSIFNQRLDSEPLEIEKEIFNFFQLKNISMWKGFVFAVLQTVIAYVRAWLLIIFLGKEISALSTISILGFSFLAMTFPIPAALGSHEAVQVFAFNSLGLGSSAATAFTLIIRGAEAILALVGLVILFQLGFFLFKNNLLKKAEKLIKSKYKEEKNYQKFDLEMKV